MIKNLHLFQSEQVISIEPFDLVMLLCARFRELSGISLCKCLWTLIYFTPLFDRAKEIELFKSPY